MGRSYWFECGKCGYRAKVSGRSDRGVDAHVQTIVCHDCKQLYDAVTRFKIPDGNQPKTESLGKGLTRPATLGSPWSVTLRPSFDYILNKLPYTGVRQFRWMSFKPQCPVSATHRVQKWNERDKCPRCGSYLERSPLPFRIWD